MRGEGGSAEQNIPARAEYPPPLKRLFTLGDLSSTWCRPSQWRDYVAELGLGSEHVPALIEITQRWVAEEQPAGKAAWAPVHAWRALAQLRAVEAVQPLLAILRRTEELDDLWSPEDLIEVFARIGSAAIPALSAFLKDPGNVLYARAPAATALTHIGQRYPESRAEVVALLTLQLMTYYESDPELNGFVICELLNLKAVESAEVIERAFAAGRVEERIVDWEAVQQGLGIRGIGLVRSPFNVGGRRFGPLSGLPPLGWPHEDDDDPLHGS